MLKKIHFWLIMAVWNVIFFFICGYWQQMDLAVDYGADLLFGLVAIVFIALGESSVVHQIYLMKKFKEYKMQVFEYRMVKQIFLLIVFHVGVFVLMCNLINVDSIFYISAFGWILSVGWVKGSEILWSSEADAFYLIGNGKVYNVENIMENTKVFELSCTRKGERDRVITIEKKLATDEQSRLKGDL